MWVLETRAACLHPVLLYVTVAMVVLVVVVALAAVHGPGCDSFHGTMGSCLPSNVAPRVHGHPVPQTMYPRHANPRLEG